MSAFLAFVAVRSYQTRYPHLSKEEVVTSLLSHRAGAVGLDFARGLKLFDYLGDALDWQDSRASLRRFVNECIRLVNPWWMTYMPYGREKVKEMLNGDQLQCFREAGLFEEKPDDEIIEWWDRMASIVRNASDAAKLSRGRLAERLSLSYEESRLHEIGLNRKPKWVALEDNTLGYDILSYDRCGGDITRKLIEVKSTLSNTVILTRGEWSNGASAPRRTVFHVWQFPDRTMQEYSFRSIEASIPLDRGTGEWLKVRIRL